MTRAARGGGARRRWGALLAAALIGCGGARRPSAQPDRPVPGVTVGAPCVRSGCAEGLTCRFERTDGARHDRCVLETGRCRDDGDCARSVQRCRRFGTSLGVCQDAGL